MLHGPETDLFNYKADFAAVAQSNVERSSILTYYIVHFAQKGSICTLNTWRKIQDLSKLKVAKMWSRFNTMRWIYVDECNSVVTKLRHGANRAHFFISQQFTVQFNSVYC